ncbi:hypothetical protein QYM36_013004, partial [Artemia franciscana]
FWKKNGGRVGQATFLIFLFRDIMMMAELDPHDWWIVVDPHTEGKDGVNLNVAKPKRWNGEEVPDNHSLWRHDRRCGFHGWTLHLLSDNITVAQCDPDGRYPCCGGGRCGLSSYHCDCKDCIDYRIMK